MNKYKVYLSFLGVDQRSEIVVEASCEGNAVNAATRERRIEVSAGRTFCPSSNITKVEVVNAGDEKAGAQ